MLAMSHYLDLANGRFNKTSAEDLTNLFKSVEQAVTSDHIVVYFHGGLVSRSAGEAAAEGLMRFCVGGGAYPVFFLWRSDLWTTLTRNLDEIAQEPVFKRLVKRLVQLALGKIANHVGARAAGPVVLESEDDLPDDLTALAEFAAEREPDAPVRSMTLTEMQVEQAETELETDDVIQAESRAIAAGAAPPAPATAVRDRAAGPGVSPKPTLMSKAIVEEVAEEQWAPGARLGILTLLTLVKHGVAALSRVIGRFSEGHDHGLYTTVVEEVLRELYIDNIGGTMWKMMKQDTADAFGDDPKIYAGTAFLEQLKAWWHPRRRITLIGHSTGAIYIGNFLEHADKLLEPDAKFNVLLLAPACSFEFMAGKLPFFTKRVDRFRLFGLKDAQERGYWEVPVLYPASLLYMVSGLFEDEGGDTPIVGMQRYFSGAEPYLTSDIESVTNYIQDRCIWSIAPGGPGLATSAVRHSAFDDDPDTRKSLQAFLG